MNLFCDCPSFQPNRPLCQASHSSVTTVYLTSKRSFSSWSTSATCTASVWTLSYRHWRLTRHHRTSSTTLTVRSQGEAWHVSTALLQLLAGTSLTVMRGRITKSQAKKSSHCKFKSDIWRESCTLSEGRESKNWPLQIRGREMLWTKCQDLSVKMKRGQKWIPLPQKQNPSPIHQWT